MKKQQDKASGKKALEPPKKLADYELSQPVQLLLFELSGPTEEKYSHLVELYDFIPKYFWGKPQRIDGRFLGYLEREFECRGQAYRVRITPARLIGPDGAERDCFPGQREELVEDALRKLGSAGKGYFLDDEAGVVFSLYELQRELKKRGHDYNLRQIKDALLICAKTSLEVETADGCSVMVASLFDAIGLQTREDWQGEGTKTKAFVRFNSLVTASIRRSSFRQFNYETSMGYKSVIARQLHKRMAYFFRQASITQQYTILLTTVIRDFGLTKYKQLRDNLRQVEHALTEMEQKNVVLAWKVERIYEAQRPNKLADARFIITPHPQFVSEVIKANEKEAKKRLKQ